MIDKEIDEFEEGFPDGVYAIPRDHNTPRVNIRAMFKYCEERNIDVNDLTDEERQQFIVHK